MEFVVQKGVLKKAKPTGNDSANIIIPSTVKVIGSRSFEWNKNIRSVVLPAGLTEIGECAFLHCLSLRSVVIPDSVTKIGAKAFLGCKELREVDLPKSLVEIGAEAFRDCSSIELLVLPKTIRKIKESAFEQCENLRGILYEGGEENKSIISAGGVLNPRDFVILEKNVFCSCERLESVMLPDNILQIPDNAFSHCTMLTEFELPSNILNIGKAAFFYCLNITSIALPEMVMKISDQAFFGCSKLEKIELNDGLLEIGEGAFGECSKIRRIKLGAAVEKIVLPVFIECPSLQAIEVSEKNEHYESYNGVLFTKGKKQLLRFPENYRFGAFVIDKSTETIADHAFFHVKRLSYFGTAAETSSKRHIMVIVGETLKKIERMAFCECEKLTQVVLPYGTAEIHECAFFGCSSLTHIDLPDTLQSVGDRAFYKCSKLTELDFKEGLESVGLFFMADCKALQSVCIPSTVKHIKRQTMKLPSLKWVKIGELIITSEGELPRYIERNGIENVILMINCEDYKLCADAPEKYSIILDIFLQKGSKKSAAYVKRKIIAIFEYLMQVNDYRRIKLLAESKCVTTKNIIDICDLAVEYTQNGGNAEIQVLLTNVRIDRFGSIDFYDSMMI